MGEWALEYGVTASRAPLCRGGIVDDDGSCIRRGLLLLRRAISHCVSKRGREHKELATRVAWMTRRARELRPEGVVAHSSKPVLANDLYPKPRPALLYIYI